jgi:hypothetical protein
MGDKRRAYKVFVRKVKKSHNFDNTGTYGNMYIKNRRGWKDVGWIHLAHETEKWRAVINTTNLQVPQNVGKFSASQGNIRFSRSTGVS